MNINLRTACLAAAVVVSSTAIAAAQNSTDSRGNANGSQNIDNGGAMKGGAMQRGSQGTTGMNSSQSMRDAPNGSAGAPPKAHGGPEGGDASQKESGKR